MRFLSEIKSGVDYLTKQAQSIKERYKNSRVLFLKTYPYGIHYIIEDDKVKVIARFHTRKNPKNWEDRL